ncbi:hypothetical protein EVAR_32826_1 [Eumeta japonica]|uniref:Uncharacterized protein n=1 Tax=Eumeta variegata TaxID=151549 RepID=A0A4C1WE70_EUMVA|nr:hypothetical protein EVAR_32826_1 [Eumeta japonica]
MGRPAAVITGATRARWPGMVYDISGDNFRIGPRNLCTPGAPEPAPAHGAASMTSGFRYLKFQQGYNKYESVDRNAPD